MSSIYFFYTFQEVLTLRFCPDKWWADVLVTGDRLFKLFFTKIVRLKAHFAGKECKEINSFSVFNYSHGPVKSCLVFAEGAWLRGVGHTTLDTHRL